MLSICMQVDALYAQETFMFLVSGYHYRDMPYKFHYSSTQ